MPSFVWIGLQLQKKRVGKNRRKNRPPEIINRMTLVMLFLACRSLTRCLGRNTTHSRAQMHKCICKGNKEQVTAPRKAVDLPPLRSWTRELADAFRVLCSIVGGKNALGLQQTNRGPATLYAAHTRWRLPGFRDESLPHARSDPPLEACGTADHLSIPSRQI